MRIVSSDSEPEELETAVASSVPNTVSTTKEEDEVLEAKRVSVAWLCFDREKTYQKNGIDYVKCNQPRCGTDFKLNPTTSTNLSRHCQRRSWRWSRGDVLFTFVEMFCLHHVSDSLIYSLLIATRYQHRRSSLLATLLADRPSANFDFINL